jgi:hypothetical protein
MSGKFETECQLERKPDISVRDLDRSGKAESWTCSHDMYMERTEYSVGQELIP